MRHDNGVFAALGLAAGLTAIATASVRRGGANDEWELVPAAPQQRAIARRQTLTDRRLAELLVSNADVLVGMSFAEAVNTDPRRIAALIDQTVMPAFYQGHAPHPGMMRPVVDAYVHKWGLERQANDGALPTKTLVGYIEENQEHATRRMLGRLPPGATRYMEQQLPAFRRVFNQAAEVAERAAQAADDYDERLDWTSLRDTLRAYPDRMAAVLAQGGRGQLGGPRGRRGIRGGGHRRIGRGNWNT